MAENAKSEAKTETLPTVIDAPRLDGFSGYTGEIEGEENSGFVIIGEKISFSNDAKWLDNSGEELTEGLEFIVTKVLRVINYWEEDDDGKSRPNKEKSRILAPGEKFPNTKLLNEQEPKSKWREAFGQMRGPWENQHCASYAGSQDERVLVSDQHQRRAQGRQQSSPQDEPHARLLQRTRGAGGHARSGVDADSVRR